MQVRVTTRRETEPFPGMEATWSSATLVSLSDQEEESLWQEVSRVFPDGAG